MSRFTEIFPEPKPIIGVIHLPALPGYPQSPGLDRVVEKALSDLSALEAGGMDGVLVENEDDHPHRVTARPETIAAMTRVTRELVLASRTAKVGVEILLNDPKASLAVALAAGAAFIRTDYFVDRMTRPDYGDMAIDPAGLLEYRDRIGARDVLIFADIQVKYAHVVDHRPLSESASLARSHRADAIVVTGAVTGLPPAVDEIEQAKQGALGHPVLVGSGLTEHNAAALIAAADAAIVGTSLKIGPTVDAEKASRLMGVVRALRSAQR